MSTIISDMVSHLQCGEALSALDAVYISNVDGKIYKYDPLDPTQVFAGIAKEAGLLNAFIRVVQSGRVKGFTGLTPGKFVYASVTVPGGFQLTEPGVTSKVVLGIAKSATELTVNGALGIKTGGDGTGSGSLDTILQLTATEQLTDWSTGNNATVLGGGVLAGSFVKDTVTPLHGAESYQYTQAAGSLNDYFMSKVLPVDIRFRATQAFLSFPFKYDGNTGDIQIVIYDVTNATVLTTLSNSVIGTNGATQTVIASALLPLTCANIRVGFQVKVLNSGKVFAFDDVQLSTQVYGNAQLNNETDWVSYIPTSPNGSFGTISVNTNEFQWKRNGSDLLIRGKFVVGSSTATEARISLPTGLVSADTSKIPTLQKAGDFTRNVAVAPIGSVLIEPSVAYMTFSNPVISGTTTFDQQAKQNGSTISASANTFTLTARVPIQGWSAGSNAVVTPVQQISSDTIPFAFKATAIVDADPIGTFNTYTYAAGSNTPTIAASAPTQTTSSMNLNGVQVFARAYNATSTTASPARVDIVIGKGLKSKQVQAFLNTGKIQELSIDVRPLSTSFTTQSGTEVGYEPTTGILTLNAAIDPSAVSTARQVGQSPTTGSAGASGYFVFNASTAPSIAALPILQPRIATLSDVKANGTNGGSASGATTQTRVLNTLVDPTGIVMSLASNQFILPAGTYYVDAKAPAVAVNANKLRLRNITDSSTSILGMSCSATSTSVTGTHAVLAGEITIATTKTFELQHYTESARGVDGFGDATSNGDVESYSIVKIMKIR